MIEFADSKVSVFGVKSLLDLINRVVKMGYDSRKVVPPNSFLRFAKVNGLGGIYPQEKNKLWTSYLKDGKRPISYPNSTEYKVILSMITEITNNFPMSSSSWGFIKRKGNSRFIWEVAKVDPDFIWKEDLKGFFPSITKLHIYKYLTRKMGWVKNVAAIVANLVTYKGVLPQGSTASPSISNALAADMHEDMLKLAEENGIRYVNYADDFYFYGDMSKEEEDKLWDKIKWEIKGIVKSHGFFINYEKVRRMRGGSRKVLSCRIKNGYPIPDENLQSLMRAIILNMLNPDKKPTINGSLVTNSTIRGKLSWIWTLNNKLFMNNFGKYINKMKRWYPDTYNDIASVFPVKFRKEFFDVESEDVITM